MSEKIGFLVGRSPGAQIADAVRSMIREKICATYGLSVIYTSTVPSSSPREVYRGELYSAGIEIDGIKLLPTT